MLHQLASNQFSDAFNQLGPYPSWEAGEASGFADYCVDKTASKLVIGNFVILSSGAWTAVNPPNDSFSLEAVFIVHEVTPMGVLLDRVLVSQVIKDTELVIAQTAALEVAREAGRLDEGGEPILPEGIIGLDHLIPKKIKIGGTVLVYALNRAGINHIRMSDGYNNPTEQQPTHVTWDKAGVDAPVLNVPGNIQVVSGHIPFSVQQSAVGLTAFKTLIGRNQDLYGRVVQTPTKIDERAAKRLLEELTVTHYMLDLSYLCNSKLVVALMSGNFSVKQDSSFTNISLLDFAKNGPWNTSAHMWSDVMAAARACDVLFRLQTPSFFTMLFLKAQDKLEAVTQDMEPVATFEFCKAQLLACWQSFGLDVTRSDYLLLPIAECNLKIYETFEFHNKNLSGKLATSRNRQIDILSSSLKKSNLSKRDRDNLALEDEDTKKKARPKDNKGIRYCRSYYAFCAKAINPETKKVYANCYNTDSCRKFSHVKVTSLNKEAIKSAVLPLYNQASVKEVVEAYLNKF